MMASSRPLNSEQVKALRRYCSRQLRQLDTPWLLVLLPPLTMLIQQLSYIHIISLGILAVPAAFLAGRRWGGACLLPALILACQRALPVNGLWEGAGNLLDGASVLLAARLGFDATLRRQVLAVRRLEARDTVLLLLLMLCHVRIPSSGLPIFFLDGSMTLLSLLMLLLGMSGVRPMPVFGLILTAFAGLWLLGPFGFRPREQGLYALTFGLWLHASLTFAALFGIGRSIAQSDTGASLTLRAAAFLSLPVIVFWTLAGAQLSVPNPIRSWLSGFPTSYVFRLFLSTALSWTGFCIALALRGRNPLGNFLVVLLGTGSAIVAALAFAESLQAFDLMGLSVSFQPRPLAERLGTASELVVGATVVGLWLRHCMRSAPERDGGDAGFINLTLGVGWQLLVAAVSTAVLTVMLVLILIAPANDRLYFFKPIPRQAIEETTLKKGSETGDPTGSRKLN